MQMLGRREGMGEGPVRSGEGGDYESAPPAARSRPAPAPAADRAAPRQPAQSSPGGLTDFDDDIPFCHWPLRVWARPARTPTWRPCDLITTSPP